MRLEVRNAYCGYSGSRPVLKDVNLTVETGEICCILGANGVGKTTLFKSILKLIKLIDGEIRIDGENIARWSVTKIAKTMAYVSQFHNPPFPYLVKDIVLLGRISSVGYFGKPSARDYEIVENAMDDMGVRHLRAKVYTDISGGERQLVMIARSLAQEPKFLVLDEPTASLDYGNMIRVINKIRSLKNRQLGIIMTTHSPDQAFMCDSKVLLVQKDNPLQYGSAVNVITEKNLKDAYGVVVKIVEFVNERGHLVRMCSPLFD